MNELNNYSIEKESENLDEFTTTCKLRKVPKYDNNTDNIFVSDQITLIKNKIITYSFKSNMRQYMIGDKIKFHIESIIDSNTTLDITGYITSIGITQFNCNNLIIDKVVLPVDKSLSFNFYNVIIDDEDLFIAKRSIVLLGYNIKCINKPTIYEKRQTHEYDWLQYAFVIVYQDRALFSLNEKDDKIYGSNLIIFNDESIAEKFAKEISEKYRLLYTPSVKRLENVELHKNFIKYIILDR